jgi:hypothetical protein
MLRPYKTEVSEQSPEGDILRFFLARGDLRAVLPIVAELADQIE